MGTTSRSTLFLLSFFSLGLGALAESAFWPIKTVDFTNSGNDCDALTEQYMLLEGHDYFDHPKFTIRWRQTTGPCGRKIHPSELASWEASYDGSTDDAEDDPPTAGNQGSVQLNMFVCSPFGEYEIDLEVESTSEIVTKHQPSTHWVIRNAGDEYELWRSVYSDSGVDGDRLSPRVAGKHTWPMEGAMGYYGIFIAGPLPPLECMSRAPSGTKLVGCFADSKEDRVLNSNALVLNYRGTGGMTAQICSDFCSGYDYFGLEFGDECFCGNSGEFVENASESDQCGLDIEYLCTGDPKMACGGYDAIRVYLRTGYARLGCFQDSKTNRIMERKASEAIMSAEICYELCNDGINQYFGTQYATECWCAIEADLNKNGEVLEMDACDMMCAGTSGHEVCGGLDTITAYEIEGYTTTPEYIGCYEDNAYRAMQGELKYVTGDMTNEVCISFCTDNGHAYAGTEFSSECWCGNSYDYYGEVSEDTCSYPCDGDADEVCGGQFALSVYSTGL